MLVYLWIEKYKLFKNEEFIFNKKYSIVKKNDTLAIGLSSDYCESIYSQFTDGMHIDFTGIIGENGTGKSTLFELLLSIHSDKYSLREKYIYIYKEEEKLYLKSNIEMSVECESGIETVDVDGIISNLKVISMSNIFEASVNTYDNEITTSRMLRDSIKSKRNTWWNEDRNIYTSYINREMCSQILFMNEEKIDIKKFKYFPMNIGLELEYVDFEDCIQSSKKMFLKNELIEIKEIQNEFERLRRYYSETEESKYYSLQFILTLIQILIFDIVIDFRRKYERSIHHVIQKFRLSTSNKLIDIMEDHYGQYTIDFDDDEDGDEFARYKDNSEAMDLIIEEFVLLVNSLFKEELKDEVKNGRIVLGENFDMEPPVEVISSKFSNVELESSFEINKSMYSQDYTYQLDTAEVTVIENIEFMSSEFSKVESMSEFDIYEFDDYEQTFAKSLLEYASINDSYQNLNDTGPEWIDSDEYVDMMSLQDNQYYLYSEYKKFADSVKALYEPLKQVEFSYSNRFNLNVVSELSYEIFKILGSDIHQFGFIKLMWNKLSSGEVAYLNIFSRLLKSLKLNSSSSIVLLFDECDLHLHPNWQRKIVNDLIDFSGLIECNSLHVILSSHSPFILSDITNDRIILLGKDEEKRERFLKENLTFGSNIHNLLKDAFFMKSTIGGFAKRSIGEVFNQLHNLNGHEKIYSEREISYVISKIGEPVVRRKLNKLFVESTSKNSECCESVEDLKNLQELISRRINKLENLND